MKDGFNGVKSCTCAKQSPVTTDASKSVILSASETDTPCSLNAPANLESQTKMEDTLPSSSGFGASGNLLFKIGIYAITREVFYLAIHFSLTF